ARAERCHIAGWCRCRRRPTGKYRALQLALEEGLQGRREVCGGRVAVLGMLRERDFEDLSQIAWYLRVEAANVGWPRVHLLVEHRDRRHTGEWRASGQRLVEHAAKRVDIGALVDVASLGLLRGHILGCADGRARFGELARALNLGDTEVRQQQMLGM